MINQIVLTGNLGDDPTVFYNAENGNPVASFDIAFRFYRDGTGWIRVKTFQRLAEITEKYLRKGDRIGRVGFLQQESWQTEEGVNKRYYQIIANSIEFIKVKNTQEEEIPI